MDQTLSAAVDTLARSAGTLAGVGARLGALDPGPGAFGADGPGTLGEVGASLHLLCRHALHARAGEAAAHRARLDELGDTVARALAGYAATDDSAHRRLAPGS